MVITAESAIVVKIVSRCKQNSKPSSYCIMELVNVAMCSLIHLCHLPKCIYTWNFTHTALELTVQLLFSCDGNSTGNYLFNCSLILAVLKVWGSTPVESRKWLCPTQVGTKSALCKPPTTLQIHVWRHRINLPFLSLPQKREGSDHCMCCLCVMVQISLQKGGLLSCCFIMAIARIIQL